MRVVERNAGIASRVRIWRGVSRCLVGLSMVGGCAQQRAEDSVASLAGVWDGGFDSRPGNGYTLEIGESGEVTWEIFAELFHGRLTAVGQIRSGRLLLERVRVTQGDDWDPPRKLHHVELHGREYLLSDDALKLFRERPNQIGPDFWWGYRRRLPKPELKRRISESTDDRERAALQVDWARWPVSVNDIEFLERLAGDDPSSGIESWAYVELASIGYDANGDVQDVAAVAAAEAAIARVLARSRKRDGIR